MPSFEPCDGPLATTTSFDLTKSNTLLHVDAMRDVKAILKEALTDLKLKGAL